MSRTASEGAVRIKDRKGRKKMQRQEIYLEGLPVNTGTALSLFFIAFLYPTVLWEAKPQAQKYTQDMCSCPQDSLFLPPRSIESSAPQLEP